MSTDPKPNDLEQGGANAVAAQFTIAEDARSATVPVKKTISCTQCRRRKLKCDRVKPCCGTCARLQHQCVFPEGRVKSTTKRRNVKDLEARLAQVEELLNRGGLSKTPADSNSSESVDPDLSLATDADWDDFEMDLGMEKDINGVIDPSTALPNLEPLLVNDCFSSEVIGFGMQEQLPPAEIIQELHEIYFRKVHYSTPVLNKYRYLVNVNLSYPLGPPLCLRYAIWATAASATDRYNNNLEELFYRRARKYAEMDEMKGQGEQFITIAHAQCWTLIANYEAQNMYLSRAWMSAGKSVRLVQMMNLHRIDSGEEDAKQIIDPARDWIDLEERRRVFWSAFCCDRYSCAGTGWPMSIDERDVGEITTKLPCSEEAYELGRSEESLTLAEAMTAEGASKISPFAGVILMACLFGHNWLHAHRPGPNDSPDDIHGEFWKRHRRIDNALLNIATFLPEHLKLPAGSRDLNIVTLNLNLQSSQICLHQAAINKARKHKLDSEVTRRSVIRSREAAEEVVNIVRTINHFEMAEMNPWMSFNLYVATGALIEGCICPDTREQSLLKLEILLIAMQNVGKKHNITHSFMHQLRHDLDKAGIHSNFHAPAYSNFKLPNWGGPKSIWHRHLSRIDELNGDMMTQPFRPSDCPSSRSAGALRPNHSTNSTTTPLPFETGHEMDGFYHRVNFDMRFRTPVENTGMNDSIRGYNVSSREITNAQLDGLENSYRNPNRFTKSSENKANLNDGKWMDQMDTMPPDPTLASPKPSLGMNNPPVISLAHRQQWFESNKMGGQSNVDTSGLSSVTDNNSTGWTTGPFDPAITADFSGIEFDPGNGDINTLLNDSSWESNMFSRM